MSFRIVSYVSFSIQEPMLLLYKKIAESKMFFTVLKRHSNKLVDHWSILKE